MYMLKNKECKDMNFFDEVVSMWNNSFMAKELKTDIIDLNDGYEVIIEVPAVKKENINISFKDEVLTVLVNVENKKCDNINYLKCERTVKKASRSYYLENSINDDIKARLEDGMLYINVKKKVSDKQDKKYIEIL